MREKEAESQKPLILFFIINSKIRRRHRHFTIDRVTFFSHVLFGQNKNSLIQCQFLWSVSEKSSLSKLFFNFNYRSPMAASFASLPTFSVLNSSRFPRRRIDFSCSKNPLQVRSCSGNTRENKQVSVLLIPFSVSSF